MLKRKSKKRDLVDQWLYSSRNRWFRRGRDLGLFIGSLILALSIQLANLVILICTLLLRLGHWLINQTGKIEKEDSAQNPEKDLMEICAGKIESCFDDVVGLDQSKDQIKKRMIEPLAFPEAAKALKVSCGGGLLLVGPPGTGKTSLAKAVAGELKAHFFHVKPSDIISASLGSPEKKIAALFSQARSQPQSIIFFDDAEGLMPSRTRNNSTVMRRVVSQLLIEWDGLETNTSGNSLLVMAASNEPWNIDPAFRRPGRFDVLIYVPLPEFTARLTMINNLLTNRPWRDLDFESLARRCDDYSGADVKELVNRAAQSAFERSIEANGEICPIDPSDFEDAFQQVKPSVSTEAIKKLDEFCSDFQKE